MEKRGRQKVDRGPVSENVALNVSLLRKKRGLSQQELSERLGELGRPMLPSALSKIESRDRGVDVDDLMALAAALEVNPSRLLLPVGAWEEVIPITPNLSVPGWAAWRWVDGQTPLLAEEGDLDAAIEDFQLHSRPRQIRRQLRHPLMLAVNNLYASAQRVVGNAVESWGDRSELAASLGFARRNLDRVAGELEAIEEEAPDRG